MKKEPVVYIEWVDSIHTSGWQPRSEMLKAHDDNLNHETIGFLIAKSKRAVTVVQSRGQYSVDAIMTIPRCAIISMREVKI